MDPFAKGFLRAGVFFLLAGLGVALTMGVQPRLTVYLLPVHAHLMLLGFVSHFIMGVSYHVLPRFTGIPVPRDFRPRLHLWASVGGTSAMAVLFGLDRRFPGEAWHWLWVAAAAVVTFAFLLFIANVFRPLFGAEPEF